MTRRFTRRLSMLAVVAAFAAGDVHAQQVIGPAVDAAAFGIRTADEAHHKRVRYARINLESVGRPNVVLNLFEDAVYSSAERDRGRQLDSDVWIGSVEGDQLGTVILTRHPSGVLFGKVETRDATYLIKPKGGPVHAIIELDRTQIPDEGEADGIAAPDGDGSSAGKIEAASVCLASTSCANQTVDVMVVYTAQARSILGGSDASAQSAIALAVAEINAAHANSGVTHTFNLVHSDLVDYAESGDANTDLSRLSGSSDGYMDEIHTWRNAYGADLVSLVTATGGCGIGYVQSNPEFYSSGAAFSTVRHDCLTGNKTLAHEMGHNSGLHHDWYVNSNSTPCEWNHGYVNQAAFSGSGRWRTIMAYNTQCSDSGFNCSRLTYWSNPSNTYTSDPMGIPQGQANPADAVFALNRAYCQVADFRASASPQPPVADFVGAPISGDYPLTVNFTDQSTGNPTSWSWTFGDGGTSSSQNPSHTYVSAGSFTVSLTATNSEGSDAETKPSYITVTVPEPPPADPTGLVATASSPSTIDITWNDNAGNEDGYRVERSPNGSSNWSQVADLGSDATSHTDAGLSENTTYYYRTYAYHATAQSGYSNVDDATTPTAPFVDHLAVDQSVASGTVSGSYTNTHSDGGGAVSITEEETKGKPSNRTSLAEVTWQFSVRPGLPATFYANAWFPGSGDGDQFWFSYSTDGSTYSDLFAVNSSGSDPGSYQIGTLGVTTGSTVWIRLADDDREPGHRSLDQVFVDHLYVRTESTNDPPPPAPVASAESAGTTEIDLSWSDVSGELGYRIDRSSTSGGPYDEVASVAANTTSYTDSDLDPSTTYYYQIVAFNGGGFTASDEVQATTDDPPTNPELHLGDLTVGISGRKNWKMTVTATIHNTIHGTESGALVIGSWSTGGSESCTTDESGSCSVQENHRNVTSATFTVTDVSRVGATYNASANDVSNVASGSAPDRTAKDEVAAGIPEQFVLNQNYPNPFNPATVVEYGLPEDQHVTVSVFNALGREIARLHDGVATAGWHRVTFDGAGLSTGTYLAVVRSEGQTMTRTMLLAK